MPPADRRAGAGRCPDVRCALAQVGIVHHFEAPDVLGDHLAQRALGPLAGADDLGHLATEGRVIEHHQVHVEQRALFLAHLRGELFRQVAHVRAHRLQRRLEQRQLGLDIIDVLVRHYVQIGRRQHHQRGPHRGARGAGNADEAGFLNAFALAAEAADRTGRLGMGDNPGELRAHGHQEGFLAFIELAAFLLLDDQYAHHPTVVDDRCTEKGGVALLAGLGEVAVARMFGGVFEVERLLTGAHQAHQTLVGRHADLADGALVETFGGHQDEAFGFRIEQIDRADLAAHGLLTLSTMMPNAALRSLAAFTSWTILRSVPSMLRGFLPIFQSRTGRRGASSLSARR